MPQCTSEVSLSVFYLQTCIRKRGCGGQGGLCSVKEDSLFVCSCCAVMRCPQWPLVIMHIKQRKPHPGPQWILLLGQINISCGLCMDYALRWFFPYLLGLEMRASSTEMRAVNQLMEEMTTSQQKVGGAIRSQEMPWGSRRSQWEDRGLRKTWRESGGAGGSQVTRNFDITSSQPGWLTLLIPIRGSFPYCLWCLFLNHHLHSFHSTFV